MKTSFRALSFVVAVAAAGLTGCSRSEGSPAAASAAAPAPAPQVRRVTLTANDTMKFSTTEIYARPGETLAITLTNEGSVPKTAMAHNWVLLTPGTDLTAFATASVTAAATNYIPEAFRQDVLAATKLLGPKESDTITVTVPQKPGRYPFVCTFPGHMQVGMRGDVVVE